VKIKDDAIISAVTLSSNRYITERFLPDKAIDLIDEAAAKLRLEMDSVPEELDEIERRIMQIEIELEAIKARSRPKENCRTESGTRQPAKSSEMSLKPSGRGEKEIVDKITARKTRNRKLKLEAERRARRQLRQSSRNTLW
jgi:ATP-dependent Clp protease ATP-binding subunit ClpB